MTARQPGRGGRAPREIDGASTGVDVPYMPYPRTSVSTKGRRATQSSRGTARRSSKRAPEIETIGTEFIKISSDSDTKKVAGKIAHDLRSVNATPTILAIGTSSLNVAVKAIAVARQYIAEDGIDITCQPAFREGMSDTCLALYLHKKKGNTYSDVDTEAEELVAKSTTAMNSLAGAIAGRAREDEAIYLIAQGAEAAAIAIGAVCKARTYLEEDKLDLHCAPKFVHLDNGMSALRFNITREKAT